MCCECARLQALYTETAERLLAAQRELARFGVTSNGSFDRLWKECETTLRVLWTIRGEIATHNANHAHGSLSPHG
jgi:hypothetical protein